MTFTPNIKTTTVSRKKVLFLITKSNWGGAQRYVYDLATHLDTDRFEVVVALGGTGVLAELLKHAHVRVVPLETLDRDISLKKEWLFLMELWSLLKKEKPDILHVNSSKAGGIGTFLGRIFRVPRVLFTAHGWAFNEDRPWWQKVVIKFLHWLTVLFSHHTIAVSRAIVTQMDWPFVQSKMKVINPGRTIGVMYNKQEARIKIADFCPRLDGHSRSTWIITIAELHPIKKLNVLISAIQKIRQEIPRASVIIIGTGELTEPLQKQIDDEKLSDMVFLAGPITEAARLLKAADLFILPSQSESYGYVIHEAGLAGVPIITTNVGGIIDIIELGADGQLIPPNDIKALAEAIVNHFKDKTKSQTMANHLKEKLEKRTVEKMTRATTAFYDLSLK